MSLILQKWNENKKKNGIDNKNKERDQMKERHELR